MKLTFLGTGTSTGVPSIACECETCISDDPRDKRLRVSVLIEHAGQTVIVDTSDRKSTRLNSSHLVISYAVFCLKKKTLAFPAPLRVLLEPWEPRSTVAISLFLVAWTMPTRPLFAESRRPSAARRALIFTYAFGP